MERIDTETWTKMQAKTLVFCIEEEWVKTLKFDNVEVNKKEFHTSKEPITLNLVNVNQIVVSDKFKHSGKGFKIFYWLQRWYH